MSDASRHYPAHAAVLELPDDLRLGGRVCPEADGLLLQGVRLVGGKAGARLSLPRGTAATLVFDNLADGQGPLPRLRVTIAGIAGKDLRLSPDPGQDSGLAERCLQALATPPMPASPAARQASPAGTPGLVATFEERSLGALAAHFEQWLAQLTKHLFDLTIRGGYAESQAGELYDAVKSLKRHQEQMTADFVARIRERFRDMTPEKLTTYQWERKQSAEEKLGLVDLEEFEGFLAVDRMINVGKDLHGEILECLTVRLAIAMGVEPLKLRLPVHVTELCSALQETLQQFTIHPSALPISYKFCSREFLPGLKEIYQALNQLLVEAGLYPGLEEEILSKGSLLERAAAANTPWRPQPPRPAESGGDAVDKRGPVREAVDNVVQRIGATLNPEKLYQSVIDALNFKRQVQGIPTHPEGREGPVADTASVVSALGSAQQDAQLRREIRDAGSLREFLAQHGERLEALSGTIGPTPENLNQIELVDNLFTTIRSQLDVSKQLQPIIGELQIPLAKLALLEPQFFLDRAHAARAVIDKLSQLAASGNFPNRTLESRVEAIIEEIVQRYDRDSGVFDSALEQIDKLVAQQANAHARNVERVVRTQEGQERLRQARTEVAAAIRERLDGTQVPAVLQDLIDKGWRDLLILTHVKDGPHSESWREHLRTLDLLAEWLAEQQGESAAELSVQRGLEAEPFVDMLEQQINSDLPANMDLAPVFAELRDILAGDKPVATRAPDREAYTPEPDSGHLRQRLGKTQRLRRWVYRVEQLHPGTWLSYRDRQGNRRRMQLAWVNPTRDRFIFVNDRGQKIADMNSVRLARLLSKGAKPPTPAETLPLVDQSMYSTLEEVQKALSFARNHDQLTNLINRDTFLDQVGRALGHANRKSSQHAVLQLNIDQFQLVNELYDQVSGDQVLAEFGKLLSQLHGRKVSSARLEGNDFGILLVDHDQEQARQVAEQIRADIEASPAEVEGEMVRFTVSIGVAPILDYSPDVDSIMAAAASAMRLAKQRGRNQVAVYEPSGEVIQQYRHEHLHSRQSLQEVLATERFVLRAQPIVQTAVNRERPSSRHYELLLGVRDKAGVVGSPESFIAAAERHGYMTQVDRWVVQEAFRWISQLMDAQKVVPNLAINLSGASITDDAFLEYLLEQISEFGVGTNRLCFEITETGTIGNLVKAADFVRAFRNIGCKFSLDDFGSGLASHNYLRELPVDYVKIDGRFITRIEINRNDFTMARSINNLAHFLGQETIAESVENARIIARLEEIGVDYLQGWGIGHPKPLEEITRELSSLEK
jgi:diguanylate cyclase (GGDEF)-like protein